MEQICYIFGHQCVSAESAQRLEEALAQVAAQGVRNFVMRHGGAFEEMAAQILRAMKARFPDLKLLCLASDPEASPAPGFDGCHRPQGMEAVPKRFAQSQGGRRMAEQCHRAVCYVEGRGDLQIRLSILHRRGVPVVDLADRS